MSKQGTVVGVSGTQSPPLEATGEDKPMGASSVESAQKGEKVEAVPDSEQRKEYFQDTETKNSVCVYSGHFIPQSSVDARATLMIIYLYYLAERNLSELQAPARDGSKSAGLFGQDYLITMPTSGSEGLD